MAKYVCLFSYSSDSAAGLLQHPADRAEAVGKLFKAAGGRLESYYWMFGPYDGMAIVDVPDARAMAAGALAVLSSGALKTLQSYELIPHEDITAIEQSARELVGSYQTPAQSQ